MKTFKGTKGKWYRREYIGKTSGSPVLDPVYYINICNRPQPSGKIVVKCIGKNQNELLANAKLIRASKELLEALQDLVQWCIENNIHKQGNRNPKISIAQKVINKAL